MRIRSKGQTRVLVTLGPTRAFLDSVRFISNLSTGALGFAICKELIKNKISVAVVAGPTEKSFEELKTKQFVSIETVDEMRNEVIRLVRKFQPHYVIFAAAVLDFEPQNKILGKRSSQRSWVIKVRPTKKIIDEFALKDVKKIGFKLEYKKMNVHSRKRFALRIIQEKNLELLCLNFLGEISRSRHQAYIIFKNGYEIKVQTKTELARVLRRFIHQDDQKIRRPKAFFS